MIGVLVIIGVAYAYQRSRLGRMLRASREDAAAAEAVGVNVHRQRLWAFTLSGALAGFAGGLYVHMLGSITADSVYLELTFLTLAMLVFGGATSLWGAVLGALVVSALDSFLSQAESGVNVGFTFDLPQGTRLVILGARDGYDADPAAVGHHGRPRVLTALGAASRGTPATRRGRHRSMRICIVGCGAVGSLFAANLATLDDVEVWAFDLVAAARRRDQRATGCG